MSELILVPLQFKELSFLDFVKDNIPPITGVSTSVENHHIDLEPFLDPKRGQYDASKIVRAFEEQNSALAMICTSVDLFIPIFTFVFGLAKLGGTVGIVSSHRLDNRFYGLPEDEELLKERLLKEVVHEFGHLVGLHHCAQFDCVMTNSPSADDVDIKKPSFCRACQSVFDANYQKKKVI